jgi:hypothetical protein
MAPLVAFWSLEVLAVQSKGNVVWDLGPGQFFEGASVENKQE